MSIQKPPVVIYSDIERTAETSVVYAAGHGTEPAETHFRCLLFAMDAAGSVLLDALNSHQKCKTTMGVEDFLRRGAIVRAALGRERPEGWSRHWPRESKPLQLLQNMNWTAFRAADVAYLAAVTVRKAFTVGQLAVGAGRTAENSALPGSIRVCPADAQAKSWRKAVIHELMTRSAASLSGMQPHAFNAQWALMRAQLVGEYDTAARAAAAAPDGEIHEKLISLIEELKLNPPEKTVLKAQTFIVELHRKQLLNLADPEVFEVTDHHIGKWVHARAPELPAQVPSHGPLLADWILRALHLISKVCFGQHSGARKSPVSPLEAPISCRESSLVEVDNQRINLTRAQFETIKCLVDVHPRRLKLEEFRQATGSSAPHQTLKKACEDHALINAHIDFPGKHGHGRGYGLR